MVRLSDSFKKVDKRIKRTHLALISALRMLLERRPFSHITVNDLCEEALISRAAFYSHFDSKYDLLKYYLKVLTPDNINESCTYEQLEESVNSFVQENAKAIKNVVENADNEVIEIVQDFLLSMLHGYYASRIIPGESFEYNVFSSFCVGGMLNCLLWQIKHKFPPDMQMLNTYLYEMLECLVEWRIKRSDGDNN